jgi:hypothetical protein
MKLTTKAINNNIKANAGLPFIPPLSAQFDDIVPSHFCIVPLNNTVIANTKNATTIPIAKPIIHLPIICQYDGLYGSTDNLLSVIILLHIYIIK